MREINIWRKGDAPPARLLKFPDGKIDTFPMCGMRVIGSEVGDYIRQIQDANLLVELIFDSRADAASFHAAVSQLVTVKDVGYLSKIVAERRKIDPGAFARSELAVLAELLRSPYASLKAARIAPEDMQPEQARRVLQAMKVELQGGAAWAETYAKYAGLHPDMRDRAKDPRSVRTLICYLSSSMVSPSGFDILTYRTEPNLRPEHLPELFRLKRGTHIFHAADGVYLYHIQSFHEGAQ